MFLYTDMYVDINPNIHIYIYIYIYIYIGGSVISEAFESVILEHGS